MSIYVFLIYLPFQNFFPYTWGKITGTCCAVFAKPEQTKIFAVEQTKMVKVIEPPVAGTYSKQIVGEDDGSNPWNELRFFRSILGNPRVQEPNPLFQTVARTHHSCLTVMFFSVAFSIVQYMEVSSLLVKVVLDMKK